MLYHLKKPQLRISSSHGTELYVNDIGRLHQHAMMVILARYGEKMHFFSNNLPQFLALTLKQFAFI